MFFDFCTQSVPRIAVTLILFVALTCYVLPLKGGLSQNSMCTCCIFILGISRFVCDIASLLKIVYSLQSIIYPIMDIST